ncbi:MAG: hypothetical protein J6K48_11805 [Lachnospiraceae bacterium]|nr:hypothetical protein [Lachnospiraceae bacterium]
MKAVEETEAYMQQEAEKLHQRYLEKQAELETLCVAEKKARYGRLVDMGKKVLAVHFDSQASLTTCFGSENSCELLWMARQLMMAEIGNILNIHKPVIINTKHVYASKCSIIS